MFEHYPIFPCQENSTAQEFYFDTKLGNRYFIRIMPADYLFNLNCIPCKNVSEFSFYPEYKDVTPDILIRPTIIHAIRTHINENRSPIIYVCDNLDQKEDYRYRLFQRWFRAACHNDFKHECYTIDFKDYKLLLGIITFQWDSNSEDYFNSLEFL